MTARDKLNRRQFLTSTAAVTAFSIVPRHVLGGANHVAPSERINVGYIGTGSQGIRVMLALLKYPEIRVTSVCDVNKESGDYLEWGVNELNNKARDLIGAGHSDLPGCVCGREPARRIVDGYYAKQKDARGYRDCSAYNDFRELLDKERDIDAVAVATPDHTHAVISIAAMKKGKHVYCQKPMTHSIHEARRIAQVAQDTGAATQVALGVSASESTRQLCEWIWAGAIGPVREVHNWSNRPIWPQGQPHPKIADPIPAGLDWDKWLGPTQNRPFNHAYLPFVWRGWCDFGTGALGDMGCYSFDTIARVLKLVAPTSVEACTSREYAATRGGSQRIAHDDSYPRSAVVRFHIPARHDMPELSLNWYDGGILPARPSELEPGQQLSQEGLLFVGDKGKILCDFTGGNPRLLPESKMQAFEAPPKTLPRSVGHYEEWIAACKGGPAAAANFQFVGRVTETLLLGNVPIRAGKTFLQWDGANLTSPDADDIDRYVNPPARPGWEVG